MNSLLKKKTEETGMWITNRSFHKAVFANNFTPFSSDGFMLRLQRPSALCFRAFDVFFAFTATKHFLKKNTKNLKELKETFK